MLTPKQEKFVQGLVSGLSQRKAYKKAYNASDMKDSTIDNKACTLFKRSEIQKRYLELMGKIENEVIESVSEIDLDLIKQIKKYKREKQTVVGFIEEAIKMQLPVSEIDINKSRKNKRKTINKSTRYAVLERAGFKCQACGDKPSKYNNVTLHIDHIIPRSWGGDDSEDNLQVLCERCNCSKGDRFDVNHNCG